METRLKKLFGVGATLLLLGAGCGNLGVTGSEANRDGVKPADESHMEQEDQAVIEEKEVMESGFTLSGEVMGDSVKLSWTYDDDLPEDARFILVRGEDENPEHDSLNYWYRVHGSKRSATWIGQPEGAFHYRVCQVDEKEGECGEYSNDLQLTIE